MCATYQLISRVKEQWAVVSRLLPGDPIRRERGVGVEESLR